LDGWDGRGDLGSCFVVFLAGSIAPGVFKGKTEWRWLGVLDAGSFTLLGSMIIMIA